MSKDHIGRHAVERETHQKANINNTGFHTADTLKSGLNNGGEFGLVAEFRKMTLAGPVLHPEALSLLWPSLILGQVGIRLERANFKQSI